MGALTSTPKSLPAIQPQVITLSEPAAAAAPVITAAESSAATAAAPDPATATRQGSLLERSRGLLSTVLTGFDGILNTTTTSARKSLLGE